MARLLPPPVSRRRLTRERLLDRMVLSADTPFIVGDVSGDGLVSPVDALQVINATARGTQAATFPAADLDHNGSINVADIDAAMSAVTLAYAQRQLTMGSGQSLFEPPAALLAASSGHSGPVGPACDAIVYTIHGLAYQVSHIYNQIASLDPGSPFYAMSVAALNGQIANVNASI